MSKVYTIFKTKIGWIGLEKSNCGISLITFPQKNITQCEALVCANNSHANKSDSDFSHIINQIHLYTSGKNVEFNSIKLDYRGYTEFSKKTLEACRNVPYGETRSYKWLADKAGSEFAYRSVGQIMAKNKFPIIVPCHRIIGSTGKLTGFRGKKHDLNMKTRFLNLENIKT